MGFFILLLRMESEPAPNIGSMVSTSYWFHACEEDGGDGLCGIELEDFNHDIVPNELMDCGADEGFFQDIDLIFNKITGNNDGNNVTDASLMEGAMDAKSEMEGKSECCSPVGSTNIATHVSTVKKRALDVMEEKEETGVYKKRGCFVEKDGGYRTALFQGKNGERSQSWDDKDGRENNRNNIRKRNRDRDSDRRRNNGRDNGRMKSGYWERDMSGKLIFQIGLWNAENHKLDNSNNHSSVKHEKLINEKVFEKNSGGKNTINPNEDQARKYQLDVLEQAKKKNTIAFLETGAGKTLIAILLIKSVHEQMLVENKKMLAIFLVPKVPLVYQVESITHPKCFLFHEYCYILNIVFFVSVSASRSYPRKNWVQCWSLLW